MPSRSVGEFAEIGDPRVGKQLNLEEGSSVCGRIREAPQ